ncbi:MAG: bifunctional diaminohydroxyphosphoribosylaminopyrimidine deaminase/5-amino-6-(5-phosphoribosylamino)uracil reductase RibD [Thermodesulfobacteriota bacterium]
MFNDADYKYMNLALDLAAKGRGFTKTNPLVGAVCAKNGEIKGRGYHEKYGQAHAEVNAIDDAGENAKGATLYVTLEPCNHSGKTPPCTEKIIKSGIKKVVVAMDDPNPGVNGGGNSYLRQNKIEVVSGLLEEKARALNLPFIKYITKKIPYTVLKLAMTLDGKTATRTGDSKWITNEKSRHWVHCLRHQSDAILVGRKTAQADNPSLNARIPGVITSDPLKIITDSHLNLDPDSGLKIFSGEMKDNTIIACCENADPKRVKKFEDKGIKLIQVAQGADSRIDLSDLLKELGKNKISSLMIEGGSMIAGSFLNSDLADQIAFFYGAKIIGCTDSYKAVNGRGPEKLKDCINIFNTKISEFDNDILVEGRAKINHDKTDELLWPVFY